MQFSTNVLVLDVLARQQTGRQLLFTLARGGQTSLDELTLLALLYGLKGRDVADAIGSRLV